ncbi:hypothetical protein ROLI_025100 [Roseobacter fucihabitans]|uniref:DUF302 domain-containing protein n=1 Tax=Roseobacter fucihabitans TaxID=1537242 RepID=A0ABZ2BUA0_9RHOB|nr:DUF302 domain-containing protein [Roseobacter litoralis]MBC6965186.1 camphor resistance protein CrcB [Roseobacter litoralis]
MIKSLTLNLALGTALLATPLMADDMIELTSPHSVTDTMDRLEQAVQGAGATVFARVDHAAGAAKIDAELRPTQLLIFGNPKIGTPAMQAAQTIGLDLPLRVLAYENEAGETVVVYHAPAAIADVHGIDASAPFVQTMTGALNKLTTKATAAE